MVDERSIETPRAAPVSKGRRWSGRILSALPVLMLLFSGGMKLAAPPPVAESFRTLGFPVHLALSIGILEVACALLYVIPKTSFLGAILVTGYLGGAVVTHLRVGDPLFTHTLFPVYLGMLAWAGLYLRDSRVRAMLVRPAAA
jgi:hypothetical protein